MGTDKSLLHYGSANQRKATYELLSNYCEEVFLSCNQEQVPNIELPYILDKENIKGPLAGILSALEAYPDVSWLSLACDMPLIDAEVIHRLIANRNPEKLATCFYYKFPEPLCTIWEPKALKPLQETSKKGDFSPRSFLENNDVQCINVDKAFSHYLTNINTPQEQKKLK